MKYIKWLMIAAAFLLLGVSVLAQETAPGTEILWDTWGVPHIFAEDTASLFYGFGWAQMQNHADAILQLYGRSRGEAAQYWGSGYVDSDLLTHTVGIPEVAQAHYDAQTDMFRSYIDAFVAGMNAYAEANPDAISDAMKPVLPVRNTDPLALAYNDVVVFFVGGGAIGASQAWSAGQAGSNAWAIAPERSASGNALLVENPHLWWSDVFVWFEAQLVAPGVDLYGATLIGLPGIEIGFNEYLGWTHTVNTHDGFDLYEINLTANGGYMLDGEEKALDVQMGSIQVLQDDGTLAEQTFPIVHTEHGPVIAQNDQGQVLAFRVVNDTTYMMEQWWQMGTATNLGEFEAAMSRVQIPMFNTVYADVDGHIYYIFNGQVPVHASGDFDYWLQIQPGDDSSLIWNELHTYDDLPKVIDPPTGFVQNANEPPWTSTIPPVLNWADFPSYMAPQTYYQTGHIFRPQTSQQMLAEDDSVTYDELIAYKHSTHVESADHVLSDLIAAAQASDSDLAKQAADVLAAWDGNTNADSQGAVLFILWFESYAQQTGFDMFATPFDINDPFNTPSGLSDPAGAVAALEVVAAQVQENYGTLDVPYGDVMRLRVGEYDLPGNGGGDPSGVFRAAWYVPDGQGKFQAIGGDSWVAVIEFSRPPQARVLISQGNATQPGSPHVGDQLELYAAQELREPWLTREAIEANLESQNTFE
ncbi:MAG: acylase [Anaerolineaceae bacterium]|nr:acylase [Anaerolineaceae bacterium]